MDILSRLFQRWKHRHWKRAPQDPVERIWFSQYVQRQWSRPEEIKRREAWWPLSR